MRLKYIVLFIIGIMAAQQSFAANIKMTMAYVKLHSMSTEVSAPKNGTVADFKTAFIKAYKTQTGKDLQEDQFILLYTGKRMDNNTLLSDYKLAENTSICAVFDLKHMPSIQEAPKIVANPRIARGLRRQREGLEATKIRYELSTKALENKEYDTARNHLVIMSSTIEAAFHYSLPLEHRIKALSDIHSYFDFSSDVLQIEDKTLALIASMQESVMQEIGDRYRSENFYAANETDYNNFKAFIGRQAVIMYIIGTVAEVEALAKIASEKERKDFYTEYQNNLPFSNNVVLAAKNYRNSETGYAADVAQFYNFHLEMMAANNQ
jgi:hypothetical protein